MSTDRSPSKREQGTQQYSKKESGCTTVPSPEDTDGDPSLISPAEDLKEYSELLIRMAKALDLDYGPPSDPITNGSDSSDTGLIALPLAEDIKDIAENIWAKPASAQAANQEIEDLYKIREEGCEFLFQHPEVDPIMAEVLSSRPGTHSSSLMEQESQKLDALGREMYSSGALGVKISNSAAVMARYQMFLWECMSQFLEFLPEEAKRLCAEGLRVAKLQYNASLHAADCNGRIMASAVVLRRHAWLRESYLPRSTRARVEDLPFDGKNLFSDQTGSVLDSIRKNKLRAKPLGRMSSTTGSSNRRYFPRRSRLCPYGKPYKYRRPQQPFLGGFHRLRDPQQQGMRSYHGRQGALSHENQPMESTSIFSS